MPSLADRHFSYEAGIDGIFWIHTSHTTRIYVYKTGQWVFFLGCHRCHPYGVCHLTTVLAPSNRPCASYFLALIHEWSGFSDAWSSCAALILLFKSHNLDGSRGWLGLTYGSGLLLTTSEVISISIHHRTDTGSVKFLVSSQGHLNAV